MDALNSLEVEELMEQARVSAQQSYSPYSGFRVGAALRLTSGEVVTGTKRSALVRAVSQFGPGIRIDAVAVANLNDAASPPCGACRQMLAEFVLADAVVLFPANDGVRTMAFLELLPLAFEMKLLP
jgi:homotetrameric cytidine deaminase